MCSVYIVQFLILSQMRSCHCCIHSPNLILLSTYIRVKTVNFAIENVMSYQQGWPLASQDPQGNFNFAHPRAAVPGRRSPGSLSKKNSVFSNVFSCQKWNREFSSKTSRLFSDALNSLLAAAGILKRDMTCPRSCQVTRAESPHVTYIHS